jgi:hypothetical protein
MNLTRTFGPPSNEAPARDPHSGRITGLT